jgi:hypothetical protein
MAHVDWMIKVKRLVVCNCDWGCPCEFMAPPTHGHCEGLEAYEIVQGHFAEVRLDGLRFAGLYRWPGPVHEGGGAYQAVIDEGASDEQRQALFKIMSGEEQEPHTLFNIYGATIETEHDPIFAPIEFEWDMNNLSGRFAVTDVMAATLEPIRNPVTGAVHRSIIKLPEGFEFREAEVVSGDFWAKAALPHAYDKRFGYITYAAYGPYGMIEAESFPQGAV